MMPDSGRLVGFTMISDNIPEPIDADLVGPYFLWKLLIDVDEQGNGFGAAMIDALVAYLRTRPGADTLEPAGRHLIARRWASLVGPLRVATSGGAGVGWCLRESAGP
jgi:GNAT superfamily N-acetyltransferase